MENNIFHAPAVAGILSRHFVEARLHVDHDDEELQRKNMALQEEIQKSVGTPYYFVIDPTSRRVLHKFGGSTFDADVFAEFLAEGVERAETGEEVAQAR